MKDFDALKDIWHGQVETPKLSFEEILSGVKKFKNSFANKLLIESFGILTVIVIFVLIWIKSDYMMWTTHLSFCIFIFCCLYYLFIQYGDYRSISNSEQLFKRPQDYIDYLKAYRLKRYRLNTTSYSTYSIFIGIAFALYFIEVYFVSPVWQTIAGVVGILIWFVLCWFMMKIYTKKEQEKLNEMIEELRRLEKQFDQDE